MALNDVQLEAVVGDNPPTQIPTKFQGGTKYGDYTDLLLSELAKRYPGEGAYLKTRPDDVLRRLGVIIKKKHPHYKTGEDKAHYQTPAGSQLQFANLPAHLKESFTIKDQPAKRREVAAVMGIADKGHATHGANFTASQTLKQIIDNLFQTVSGPQQATVADKVKKAYDYDLR